MADLIPGYDYVGRGFDVFGTFDIKSLAQKERLFSTNIPSEQTYKRGEAVYTVPQNTAVLEVGTQGGRRSSLTRSRMSLNSLAPRQGLRAIIKPSAALSKLHLGVLPRAPLNINLGCFTS